MSDDKDYSHLHDPQAVRSRTELWVIFAIVAAVIFGGLIWRAVAHKPAKPQRDWGSTPPAAMTAPAAAGVRSAPPAPAPRPAPP